MGSCPRRLPRGAKPPADDRRRASPVHRRPKARRARRPERRGSPPFRWLGTVAAQIFLLQLVVVLVLAAAGAAAVVLQRQHDGETRARKQALAVAETFALAPGTALALESPDPAVLLRVQARKAQLSSGADFLSVLTPQGRPVTDAAPESADVPAREIGRALEGRTSTGTFPGGPAGSVRAVVPVVDADRRVVGVVTAGVRIHSPGRATGPQVPMVLEAAALAAVLAVGGTFLVGRRLRRQTRGLGPAEMARMYEHHDAVLHAVREGVLIVDADGRVLLANDEARRLLDLPEDTGRDRRHVGELGLGAGLTRLLESGGAVSDAVFPAGDRLLAVNTRRTTPYGGTPDPGAVPKRGRLPSALRRLARRPAGTSEAPGPPDPSGPPAHPHAPAPRASRRPPSGRRTQRPGRALVASFRDTTELQALSGRAEAARERLTLLYEAGMRIGTRLDVRRTARELAEVAVPRMADVVSVDLLESVLHGEEPAGAADRMRRVALRGAVTPVPLRPVGGLIRSGATGTPAAAALRDGRAVRVPDLYAAEDWRAQDPKEARRALDHGIHSLITVPLRAQGVTLGVAGFWRGSGSARFEEEDVTVAEELVARAAVAIDNARRYSREHAMSVALQRSLLPRGLPEQEALEPAWRYLPARSGVSGDWFDVIPLSGFRVALVVGDVVGHGLHAAVTMGRLRTAVLNFSSLDLPPDELLGRLDEMVTRLDTQAADADGEASPVTGATCLYAVYDPVGGQCTVSRAGHLAPAVVDPEGRVSFPELPLSPPLGVGGVPFEAGELTLPEGSRLVLFTDGLVESRGRDVDEGLALLGTAVAHAGRTPEETCRDLVEALLPERPGDDVALLVARTRLLAPSRVAVWEVPFDAAAVSEVRTEAVARLHGWGLEDAAFTVELLLSELLSNAVRYGAPPVRVRLLRGRSLVCEVSDGSSTSPHPRRAAATDEGGRGLFLVSRFAQRWGTRYGAHGKVIWAELGPGGVPEPAPGALPGVLT